MNQASLRVLAIATVMSIPALAEDQYIIGYGGSVGASRSLAGSGSAEPQLFEYRKFADFDVADPRGGATFSELAGGVGYGTPVHLATKSPTSHTASLYDDVVADINATIARGDRQPAPGSTVQSGAREIPPVQGPGAYALMLAGLGAVGFVVTRRRS